jgi:Flp pilus assembly protein TadG
MMSATIRARVRHWLADEDGAAAAELGIFVLILAPIILNLVDMGSYAYQRMELENAAQAGAQAAWANCTSAPVSACTNLSPAVAAAVQSTSLGSNVSWTNSGTYASDAGYYCPDGANNAFVAATVSTTCTNTNALAGYYAKISVSFTFRPVFSAPTIASLFPNPITQTTWTRIR